MTWKELFAALRRPFPLVGVLAAALGLFLIGGAVGTDKTIFGPITAAWIQAVGSIAAIVAAILIAGRQSRVADLDRWETTATRVQIVRFLSAQLLEAMEEATRRRVVGERPTFAPSNFDSIRKGLDEVPLIDLHSGRLAISVLNQRRGAFFYQQALEMWGEVADRLYAGVDEPDATEAMRLDPFYDRAETQRYLLNRIEERLVDLGAKAYLVHQEIIEANDHVAIVKPRA